MCELQEDYDYLTKNTLDRGSHGNIVQLPQGRKLEHYIAIRKSRISDEEVRFHLPPRCGDCSLSDLFVLYCRSRHLDSIASLLI